MPGVTCNWIEDPLRVVSTTLANCNNAASYREKIALFFSEQLKPLASRRNVQSMNSTLLHDIRSNTLVHFRCMIQDMFGPEYYYDLYETRTALGEKMINSGRFQDVINTVEGVELVESGEEKTVERSVFYCVPVPGETDWVKEGHMKNCSTSCIASASTSHTKVKRSLEEDGDESMEIELTADKASADTNKRTKTGENNSKAGTSSSCDSHTNLNFPLPGETGPACLVKIYENADTLKLNDIIDVYGVISLHPTLSHACDDDDVLTQQEQKVHHPPASLIPRLHAIVWNKLETINPVVDNSLDQQTNISKLKSEASCIRENLISVLEQALCGDSLSAEYLLCHLLSSVYLRKDAVAIGKLSLNLIKLPDDDKFSAFLRDLLQKFVTSYYYLPMTLENMNKMTFIPTKNYDADRLVSGILQLPDRCQLVLDETTMKAGQLDQNGVRNLTSLGNLVRWQKVSYDFKYHQQDFPTDVTVLILSEGKSLLPSDVMVELQLSKDVPLESRQQAINTYLHEELLEKIRFYITTAPWIDYKLSEEMQKVVQEDFVAIRQESKDAMTVDDFHTLLVLARLLSISLGLSDLTLAVWEKAKAMECERRARLQK